MRWLAVLLLLAGCGAEVPTEPSARAGVPALPRVASISREGTEVVLALGAADALVAVDAESARLPGLAGLPILTGDPADLARVAADVVIAGGGGGARTAPAGPRWIAVQPHDLDDAWALCREIGAALGRSDAAHRFVRSRAEPLARLAAESFGQRRPRVAVLLGTRPPVVAGGHGFAADLVEIAGGEIVTHGTEATQLAWTREDLVASAPELIVVLAADGALAGDAALAPAAVPVMQLEVDLERIWLEGALDAARLLRTRLDELR